MAQTVFDNYGTAHAWASKSLDQGRSNNGNLYFIGPTIFSYGNHFPAGYFFQTKERGNYRGAEIVLINGDSYSVSTAKHLNYIRRAVSHFKTLELPALGKLYDTLNMKAGEGRTRRGTEYIQREILDQIASTEKAISRMRSEYKIASARAEIANLEAAARFVWHEVCGKRSNPMVAVGKATAKAARDSAKRKLNRRIDHLKEQMKRDSPSLIAGFESLLAEGRHKDAKSDSYAFKGWIDHMDFQLGQVFTNAIGYESGATGEKEARKLIGISATLDVLSMQNTRDAQFAAAWDWVNAQREEYRALVQMEHGEQIAKWKAGESVPYPHNAPMCLRIKDGELQTCRRAAVPLSDAITLTKAAIACRKRGTEWKRNGETKRVGMFQTDRITERGDLIVGCHNIPWAAIADCIQRHAADLPAALVEAVQGEGVEA